MATVKELKEQRAKLIHDARELINKPDEEKRSLTEEERGRWDTMWDDAEKLKDQAKEIEGDEKRRSQLEEAELGLKKLGERRTTPEKPEETRQTGEVHPFATEEYRAAFGQYLLRGKGVSSTEEFRALQETLPAEEFRALQSDLDTGGGYMVTPEQMATDIIKDVDDLLYIRQWARTETLPQAKSLGILRRTTKISTFAWGSEIGAPTEDTALAYGKRVLEPHYMSGLIKVSTDLLRFSTRPAEAIFREELAVDSAELQEDGFLLGHGSQQPLGVFTASADGISTSRDVSTGNSTTAMAPDGLIEAKFSLKPQYRANPGTRWLFHRDGVKQISKMKDGEGQYIWRPGLVEGQPDRLLNLPIFESERVPNTFTTGLYVGILGDWNHYRIVDALDMEIQRLDQLYALTFQVGFIARLKLDGQPDLEEAWARVKLA